jgi:hypothetical protein
MTDEDKEIYKNSEYLAHHKNEKLWILVEMFKALKDLEKENEK